MQINIKIGRQRKGQGMFYSKVYNKTFGPGKLVVQPRGILQIKLLANLLFLSATDL